jgi:hypothetical protein
METKGKRGTRDIGSGESLPVPMTPAAELEEPAVEAVEAMAAGRPAVVAEPKPAAEPIAIETELLAALARSQAMLARGLEALSNEMAGLARSEIDAAARGAAGMLAARTIVDAIEVNFGFARSNVDSWLGSAARLSELAARLTAEASDTLLTQLGKSWLPSARFAA